MPPALLDQQWGRCDNRGEVFLNGWIYPILSAIAAKLIRHLFSNGSTTLIFHTDVEKLTTTGFREISLSRILPKMPRNFSGYPKGYGKRLPELFAQICIFCFSPRHLPHADPTLTLR